MECNLCLFNKITFGSVPIRLLKYILCGTLILSATAALSDERTFELPIREHVFENGLRLLVIERPRETRVVGKIFTDMGALNETPGQYGSAHFLEHLMFKGTPTLGSRDWPREKEIHERIQRAEDALEEELNRARNALRERGVFHDYQHQETTPRVGELRALI